MNPVFNTKTQFYDYFPHISPARMKELFGLGYYEQVFIREEIQKVLKRTYSNLVKAHDLRHADIYDGLSDQFDLNFFNEYKTIVRNHFRSNMMWDFLDDLLPQKEITDDEQNANFQTKILATLGYGLPRSLATNKVPLKDALVALLNYDIDALSGRELSFMANMN